MEIEIQRIRMSQRGEWWRSVYDDGKTNDPGETTLPILYELQRYENGEWKEKWNVRLDKIGGLMPLGDFKPRRCIEFETAKECYKQAMEHLRIRVKEKMPKLAIIPSPADLEDEVAEMSWEDEIIEMLKETLIEENDEGNIDIIDSV